MKIVLIIILLLSSFLIVGITAFRSIMERLNNSGEFSKRTDGVELTKKIEMVSHRGLSCVAPENTLASFKLAAQAGFKYIETDIRDTKDGHWVIMHDEKVDRTTDGKGAVQELTLEQIKNLKITRGSGINTYSDEKVPTLKEYLDVVTEGGAIPVIEVKCKGHRDFKDVIFLLKEYGLTDKAIIIDYDAEHLMTIRKLCPEIKTQLLCHYLKQKYIDKAEEIGNCGLDVMYNFQANNALCRQVVEKGLPFNCWTVDSEPALKKIYALGARFATTNCLVPAENQQEK